MKDEYDFSGAERGKFHRPGAQFNLPIYLDQDVVSYFRDRAEAKGIAVETMINELLKKDIALIEGIK